jgi:hypothetical protein
MIGKNKSNAQSLVSSINFFKKIKWKLNILKKV